MRLNGKCKQMRFDWTRNNSKSMLKWNEYYENSRKLFDEKMNDSTVCKECMKKDTIYKNK